MDNVTQIRIVAALLMFAVILPLYFLPSILGRKKRNIGAIFALNVLAGWTFIGWIVALVWALSVDQKPQTVIVNQAAPLPGPAVLCGFCGRYSSPGAQFCGDCGRRIASGISAVALLIATLLIVSPAHAQASHPCGPGGAWNCVGDSSVTAAQPTKAAAPTAPASDPAVSANVPLPTKIELGSTVYVEPMDGFENYLLAALQKKKVALVRVANEVQATYVIKGTWEEKKASWAKMIVFADIHSDDAASVQLIDKKSGAILFAYAVNKKNTWHGDQTTAEACAKHLKEQMEK